jgi:hypothetical protein
MNPAMTEATIPLFISDFGRRVRIWKFDAITFSSEIVPEPGPGVLLALRGPL